MIKRQLESYNKKKFFCITYNWIFLSLWSAVQRMVFCRIYKSFSYYTLLKFLNDSMTEISILKSPVIRTQFRLKTKMLIFGLLSLVRFYFLDPRRFTRRWVHNRRQKSVRETVLNEVFGFWQFICMVWYERRMFVITETLDPLQPAVTVIAEFAQRGTGRLHDGSVSVTLLWPQPYQ